MKTAAIIGTGGGIGQHAVRHAIKLNYNVITYLRNPEKLTLKDDHLKVIKGEITDYTTLKNALKGADAVIWCAGIPMKRKYENKTSLKGHETLLKAMDENNIKRLIDWSTPSVKFKEDKKSIKTVLPSFLAELFMKDAKHELTDIAEIIKKSNTDWIVVRFLSPTNGKFKGGVKVSFGDNKLNFNVSREDIARFMIEQIDNDKYIHSMPIIGG